jgi:hypothetical protein
MLKLQLNRCGAECACASFVPPAKSFALTYSAIVLVLFSKL